MDPLLARLLDHLDEERRRIDLSLERLSDAELWWRPRPKVNSIANLCLHLAGNESHYIGAGIGKTGYLRDRAFEFSATGGVARAELTQRLDAARASTRAAFASLSAADFDRAVDVNHPPEPTVLRVILHVTHHYAYHCGQIVTLARIAQERDEHLLQWRH